MRWREGIMATAFVALIAFSGWAMLGPEDGGVVVRSAPVSAPVTTTPTTAPAPVVLADPQIVERVVEVPVYVTVIPDACRELVAIGNEVIGLAVGEGQAIWSDLTAYLSSLPGDATYADVYPKIVEYYARAGAASGAAEALHGRWTAAAAQCG